MNDTQHDTGRTIVITGAAGGVGAGWLPGF